LVARLMGKDPDFPGGAGRVVAGRAAAGHVIADEVMGGWGLLKEWRQELVAAKV